MPRRHDLGEEMREISGTVTRLLHHHFLVIYLFDSQTKVLRVRHVTGSEAPALARLEIPIGARVSGRCADARAPIVFGPGVKTLPDDRLEHDFHELLTQSAIWPVPCSLSVPLLDGDQVLGVLALYDLADRPYALGDARRLDVAARQIADAVKHAMLYSQIQEDVMSDPLTALPNARFLFGSFDRELERAVRQGTPLGLVQLDVNDFKSINDRFGVTAGDRILRGVARAVRSQLRPNDTCVRYSGDEFIITVPGMDTTGLKTIEMRLEAAITRHKFVVIRGQAVLASVSMGAAAFPEDGQTFEALMAQAGARMYRRKFSRRASTDLDDAPASVARIDISLN